MDPIPVWCGLPTEEGGSGGGYLTPVCAKPLGCWFGPVGRVSARLRCAVLLWLAVAQVMPGGTGAKRGVGKMVVRMGVGFQTEV